MCLHRVGDSHAHLSNLRHLSRTQCITQDQPPFPSSSVQAGKAAVVPSSGQGWCREAMTKPRDPSFRNSPPLKPPPPSTTARSAQDSLSQLSSAPGAQAGKQRKPGGQEEPSSPASKPHTHPPSAVGLLQSNKQIEPISQC